MISPYSAVRWIPQAQLYFVFRPGFRKQGKADWRLVVSILVAGLRIIAVTAVVDHLEAGSARQHSAPPG